MRRISWPIALPIAFIAAVLLAVGVFAAYEVHSDLNRVRQGTVVQKWDGLVPAGKVWVYLYKITIRTARGDDARWDVEHDEYDHIQIGDYWSADK